MPQAIELIMIAAGYGFAFLVYGRGREGMGIVLVALATLAALGAAAIGAWAGRGG